MRGFTLCFLVLVASVSTIQGKKNDDLAIEQFNLPSNGGVDGRSLSLPMQVNGSNNNSDSGDSGDSDRNDDDRSGRRRPWRPSRPQRPQQPQQPQPQEETQSLEELYADALAEGGRLVIYAGGDVDSQAEGVRQAFQAQFPEIDLEIVVDYSKFHDVRVDNQLETDTLVPDVVQLQTLQDFTRWKRQGELLRYRPAGYSQVHPMFKDRDGAWVSILVLAFSYMHADSLGADAPTSPRDLVDARWAGQIASSYPHDDDAVLYLFKLYADAYGWDWVSRFAAQQPRFARGSFTPRVAVASGEAQIGVGGSGSLLSPPPGVQWALPTDEPFMAWGQRAAIMRRAAHPAAAKLYLNWQLSVPVQRTAFTGWSVRTDVPPQEGLLPIWEYNNANIRGFERFMADRAEVERWKQTFALYFGEVEGPPTPGALGLRPGA